MIELVPNWSARLDRRLRTSADAVRKEPGWLGVAYFAVLGQFLALLTIGSTMSMGFSFRYAFKVLFI